MSFRFRFIGLSGLVVAAGILLVLSFRSPAVVSPQTGGTVSLTVDFGDAVREWQDIPLVTGATAFSIMEDAMREVKMPFVYDPSFGAGVFVRQIGDKKNGDGDRYWQYWVNPVRSRPAEGTATAASGRPASNGVNAEFPMVAADKYILQSGDWVEWKFNYDSADAFGRR